MNRERIELTARGKLEIVLSRLGYVTPEIPANGGFLIDFDLEES